MRSFAPLAPVNITEVEAVNYAVDFDRVCGGGEAPLSLLSLRNSLFEDRLHNAYHAKVVCIPAAEPMFSRARSSLRMYLSRAAAMFCSSPSETSHRNLQYYSRVNLAAAPCALLQAKSRLFRKNEYNNHCRNVKTMKRPVFGLRVSVIGRSTKIGESVALADCRRPENKT